MGTGEEEMIIVGTVQQEEDCTWQDACNAWGEQDEEMAAGVRGAFQPKLNCIHIFMLLHLTSQMMK
jgi:hypothetical protein